MGSGEHEQIPSVLDINVESTNEKAGDNDNLDKHKGMKRENGTRSAKQDNVQA